MMKFHHDVVYSTTRLLVAIVAVVSGCAVVVPAGAASTKSTLAPTIVGSSLPSATQGIAYSATLSATGGTAPYTWSLLTGPVPLGLVLSSSGTLSGVPGTAGMTTIDVRVTDALGESSTATLSLLVHPAPSPPQQITVATAAGDLLQEGSSTTTVSTSSFAATATAIVGIADAPDGLGAWGVTEAGRVMIEGAVPNYGRLTSRVAKNKVVGIASNPTGTGYWIVTRGGHVYGFGAARSRGSLSVRHAREAVVGIARGAHGGYYLLQATGKVTGFGGARPSGSVPARRDHLEVAGISATLSGNGYWVVSTDGQVFRFGAARSYRLEGPAPTGAIAAIATTTTGIGYYLVSTSGVIFSYGAALQLAPVSVPPSDRVVGIAVAV